MTAKSINNMGISCLIGMLSMVTACAIYGTISRIDNSAAEVTEEIPQETEAIIYIETEPVIATPADTIPETETAYTWESLGTYKLTAYCPCSICCGKWAGGKTYSGTMPAAGRTIAVDKSIIPMGSVILIDGIEYIAEDTGNFKGKHIDIYFDSHKQALNFGVQRKEIFIKNEP